MIHLRPSDVEILDVYMRATTHLMQELGSGASTTAAMLLCQAYRTEGASLSALAEKAGISKFAATRAVKALGAQTLVACVVQGREKHVYVTPRGVRLMRRFLEGTREESLRVRKAALRRGVEQVRRRVAEPRR